MLCIAALMQYLNVLKKYIFVRTLNAALRHFAKRCILKHCNVSKYLPKCKCIYNLLNTEDKNCWTMFTSYDSVSNRYRSPAYHVQAWYDEVKDYTYPYPHECNPWCPERCTGPMCTHYTQVGERLQLYRQFMNDYPCWSKSCFIVHHSWLCSWKNIACKGVHMSAYCTSRV